MEFQLEGEEFITLQALLKVTSLCDRGGDAKVVIITGQVKVDNVVEKQRGKKIRAGQVIEFDGKNVTVQS